MTTATRLTLPVVGSGRNLLTHSRMQTNKTCARKGYYRYELGLRRIRQAVPLRMGKAIHHGIELWETGADNNTAIFEATAEYESLPVWCNTDETIAEWLVEGEIVRRLLSGYFWRWDNDALEVVSAEETFIIPIINPDTGSPTPTFQFAGKWDGIVRMPDGRLLVKETKTVGQDISPESDYWKRLQLDQQISGYMLAARKQGYDVQGVLYDVIRKPAIKPRKLTKAEQASLASTHRWYGETIHLTTDVPDHETPAMYGARLTDDIGNRPDFYFARREIARLESDIDDFRRELWEQQLDLRQRQRTNRWYRNTSACLTMGRCEYFDLCVNRFDPSQRMPDGFEIVECVHPELSNGENDNDISTD